MKGRIVVGVGAFAVAAAVALLLFGGSETQPRDEGGALPSGNGAAAPPSSLPDWTVPVESGNGGTTTVPEDVELFGVTGAKLDPVYDVTLYVDPVNGQDGNSGTSADDPLATLTAALGVADGLRAGGQGVRILLAPGVYRESFGVTGDEDGAPVLLITAEEPGTAIVSGADAWSGWIWDETAEAFVHEWPFDWQPAPDVEEIVGRRELVVVDGTLLTQVLRLRDLDDGAFFVDASEERIYLRPPRGSAFPALTAEVAVRRIIMEFDGARNVMVTGLVLRHGANSLEATAVRITNSDNVVFDHNEVVENNWTGFGLSTSQNITISNNTINRNGGGGAGIFKPYNVVFSGNDTSYNNWRGVRADYLGWSIAGVKSVGASHLAIHRHRAWGNNARGLWLDFDVSHVSIVDSSWCDNLTDGLFLEAVQGPVVVRNVEACRNGRYGLLLVNLYGARIEHSRICANAEVQIHMDAEPGGREVTTATGVLTMTAARDLEFRSNVVAGDGTLLRLRIPSSDFDILRQTLDSDDNAWIGAAGSARPFEFPGARGDLETWQAATGQDGGSTWEVGSADDAACAPSEGP